MLNFFLTKNHPIQYAIKKYSRFDYIKRRYEYELNKILNYYHNRDRAVEGRNIFSRMIHLLSPNIDTDIGDFFSYADREGPYIAKQFHLVSNMNKGRVYENLFYHRNNYVIINHVNSGYNLFNIKENWINLCPLRITYSNITDLDFYLLDNTKALNYKTVMVCELDIILMLLQYYFWCKERLHEDFSTNSNVFVYKVLLPNAMKTGIDICIFNRFMNLFYNYDMNNFELKHPFHVIDFRNYVDEILKLIIKDIDKGNYAIEQVLHMLPTIVNENMIDALYINNPWFNRQSEWTIWVARIKYIDFLIDLIGKRGVSRNKHLLNRLPSRIRELENRSTHYEHMLPNELLTDMNYHIENIKEKIGRR